MRRNTKVPKKMNAITKTTAHFGAILGMLFVMVIMNLLASSSCQQQMKAIGERERELARLEDALNREATRWEAMKTPEKIDTALLRHGLAMKPPRADQNVYMKANGTPYPGQPSIALAKRRNTTGKLAMYNGKRR